MTQLGGGLAQPETWRGELCEPDRGVAELRPPLAAAIA
jgi:hypothetical protein